MAKSAKGSFRDSYTRFRQITEGIGKGVFSRIYVLMGEEPFFIDAVSDLIAENGMPEDMKPFNQSVLYGGSTSAAEVVGLCRQYPMMGDKSIVIIKDAQNMSDLQSLVHYVKDPLDTTTLVICYRNGNIDKRSAFYKALAGSAEILESVPPREYEVDAWITETAKRKGYSIGASSVQMLVQYLGADLTKINNELDKLITALPADSRTITPSDIENFIGISKDYNNFELTKALSEGDAYRALRIARHFADSQKQNPYVVTIQMLHTHFYRIFNLAIILWTAKKRKAPVPSDMELAKMLQLPSTFFLKEYMQAVSRYNSQKAFTILGLIREYDMKGKGVNQGSTGTGELLEELIIKITAV